MLLVLFFILLIIFITIILGTLKINIKEIDLSSENIKNAKFNIQIGIYLFNKINILGLKINKKKIEKLLNSKVILKFKNMNFKKVPRNLINPKKMKEYLKILNVNLEKLNLKIWLDTKNVLTVTFLIPVISSFLALIINNGAKKYYEEKYNYNIKPLYQGKNQIKIYGNCIISLKLVHIIHIIYILFREGRKNKNERTSNRRFNDNCYE